MFRKTGLNERSDAPGRPVVMGLLSVGLAVAAHVAFQSYLPKHLPFAPFAVAVLASCKWGGGRGGLVATIASGFVLRFWFLPPAVAFWDERSLGLGLFVAAGLCVSWQAAVARRVAAKLARPVVQTIEAELPPFEYQAPTPAPSRRVAA